MKKILLSLLACSMLVGCSSRWFEKQPLEDITVTFQKNDEQSYNNAVMCAKKMIVRPTFNVLFTFNSEFTHSFSSNFRLDADAASEFYATLDFKAKKGVTTIELGKFYRVSKKDYSMQYAYDFYGNQYDYYKPQVDEFMQLFEMCVK